MHEVEAKFLIRRPEQFEKVLTLLQSRGYQVTPGPTSLHVDRYFDTEDWSILRAGWTYRHRRRGRDEKLTLKSFGKSRGAVFTREEINQPLSGPRESGHLPPGPVQERLGGIVDERRRHELFRIENRRTIYRVETPGDDPVHLELGLDRARIRARNPADKAPGRLQFTELEVELQQGRADAVDEVARVLEEVAGLIPAHLSKFERGIQTAGLYLPDESASGMVRQLRVRDPVVELIFRSLVEQLLVLEREKDRASEGLAPGAVHKMRIAIRRIRSLLRTFSDIFPQARRDHLDAELRWLARQLGRARDADVCGQAVSAYRKAVAAEGQATIDAFEQRVNASVLSAYDNLTASLASGRYLALIHELTEFANGDPRKETTKRHGDLRISECGKRYAAPAIRKMLEHGRAISAGSTARQLHKLRIEAKRLRYLLEFFAIVQTRRWRRAIESAELLQDVLGPHQDAVMAREQLQEFAAEVALDEGGRDTLLTTGRLLQLEEQRAARYRKRFSAAWKRFEEDAAGLT